MSRVRRLWFEGPAGRLEGLLRVACPARAAAVVAHPHPLHGGTMHNPVVFHAERELHRIGVTTMRFNFRGVEASDGEHDKGDGEVGDVEAAVDWLRGVAPELPLVFVGYSFGSWCGFRHSLADDRIAAVVGIGLPVRLYDFGFVAELGRPCAVVQGSEDEFGSPAEVERVLARGRPPGRVYPVDGAPHLFPDQARDAAAQVVAAVRACLGVETS